MCEERGEVWRCSGETRDSVDAGADGQALLSEMPIYIYVHILIRTVFV